MGNEIAKRTSRRTFVREVSGIAAAGAFITAPCMCRVLAANAQAAGGAGAQKAAAGGGEKLVAPCGLYCGACPMYLATQENSQQRLNEFAQQFSSRKIQMKLEDVLCDGCIGGGRVAVFCQKCAMRSCAEAKPDVTRCADCPDFPCSKITNFNNDGMTHHSEVLENSRRLREMGITRWAKYEEERWRCPECKEKMAWYDKACRKCGAKRSEKLFPLKQA